MGLRRAALAARALIDAAGPQLLVSLGVAGAVDADLEIGDVVAARNTCLLDKHGLPGPFQPLAVLSETAWQAARLALQPGGAGLYYGTAVTTHASQFIRQRPQQLTNPVLEMETAAIAAVAAGQGLPLLSLRAISDGLRAPIPFNLERMLDGQDNLRTVEILKTILRHPGILPQLLRMGRNTRQAAANAALALLAILTQPGPVIFP